VARRKVYLETLLWKGVGNDQLCLRYQSNTDGRVHVLVERGETRELRGVVGVLEKFTCINFETHKSVENLFMKYAIPSSVFSGCLG
jgi:hypothetical protein